MRHDRTNSFVVVPVPYYKYNFKHRLVTLLADDLVIEHGIVSMRVGFALRSAEIKPIVRQCVDWFQ